MSKKAKQKKPVPMQLEEALRLARDAERDLYSNRMYDSRFTMGEMVKTLRAFEVIKAELPILEQSYGRVTRRRAEFYRDEVKVWDDRDEPNEEGESTPQEPA